MAVAVSPREVRNIRIGLAAFVVAVLLLVFAVPRTVPPPPSAGAPPVGFVDNAGIVPPEFASGWSRSIVAHEPAEMLVYVDRKPPEADVTSWAIRNASDWKVGLSKNDTGLVLFVFTEPRIARIDVGYGLEDRLTDARVRQLLEAHLAPAFAAGEYTKGFDALLFALRKEIGGEDADSIHARAQERYRQPDPSWIELTVKGLKRLPRVSVSIVRAFMEEGPMERFAIVVAVAVGLAVLAMGIAVGIAGLKSLASMPAALRAPAGGQPAPAKSIGTLAIETVIGLGTCFACLALVALAMLASESLLKREGRFSGAGSMIVWPR